MKDFTGKFTIAIVAAPVLLLLGFLSYRKVSGERKSVYEGGVKKGEDYDKTSVELGKTENVDDDGNLDTVLLSGSSEIKRSFAVIIKRMITEDREKYSKCLSLEKFMAEFMERAMNVFLANREAIERIPRTVASFERLLESSGLLVDVLTFIKFNNEGETEKTSAPDRSVRTRTRVRAEKLEIKEKPFGEFTVSASSTKEECILVQG